MNNRKKVITHLNNLPPEVLEALHNKYPDGYMNYVFKVTKPNNDFFYAVTVDTEDTSYLVKVNVKIDNVNKEELDEQIFAPEIVKDTEIKMDDQEDEKEERKTGNDDDEA